MNLSRRRFLQIGGLAAGGLALRSLAFPSIAHAVPEGGNLLLTAYFSGGWDQLLALDPRPTDQPQYQHDAAAAKDGTGIFPAYDLVSDARITGAGGVLSTVKSGVQKAGALTFGPAVPQSFLKHYQDLAVLRGVFMGTLAHEAGRRYLITGKFPRGLAANGSAITTAVAANGGDKVTAPNLAISTESYNQTFPAFAAPVSVGTASDVLNLLKQSGTPLDAKSDAAVRAFEQLDANCREQELDEGGIMALFRASRSKARTMIQSTKAAQFNFKLPAPDPQIADLFSHFNIATGTDLTRARGKAALAAQALTTRLSNAVSVELANGLDDHDNWGDTHATTLLDGFDALGLLIDYLKATPFEGGSGESAWAHTTLLVFSEFARTPMLNARDGRDHHIASSCALAGPGIKGNIVCGATTDKGMSARNMDFDSGQADDSGLTLRPQDIHATLYKSMGMPYDEISNQSPNIIDAVLKNP
jgi:uncharacterized protein (DUF1501 family)